jgi:hypothetical protein
MPPRKTESTPFDLYEAEERVMACLDKQTEELRVYPSTPHTEENQQRILSTLHILVQLKELKYEQD